MQWGKQFTPGWPEDVVWEICKRFAYLCSTSFCLSPRGTSFTMTSPCTYDMPQPGHFLQPHAMYLCSGLPHIPIIASDTLNWENTEETLTVFKSSSCTAGSTEGCGRTPVTWMPHCALALSSTSTAAGTAGWGSNNSWVGKKLFSRASQSDVPRAFHLFLRNRESKICQYFTTALATAPSKYNCSLYVYYL